MLATTNFYFNLDILYNQIYLKTLYSTLSRNTFYTYGKGVSCLTIVPITNYKILLKDIISQFKNPNIITDAAFLHNSPNGILNPHIDETRLCGINIPVTITDSYLHFFNCKEITDAIQTVIKDNKIITRNGGKACLDCSIIEKVCYKSPICFDASRPHGVTNNSNTNRITLSLDIDKTLSFDDIAVLYQTKKLFA